MLFGITILFISGIGVSMDASRTPKDIGIYFWAFIFTGLPATIATHYYAKGMMLSKNTGILAMSMTLSVILSYMVSIFRYGEQINPIAVMGSISIILGIAMTIFLKTPEKKP